MATAPNRAQARLFAELIAEFEPRIHRAFMASVNDLHAGVDWSALLSALQAGDMESAILALNISEAAFAEYSSQMTAAYAKSGASTAAQIQQLGYGAIGTRFNQSNPRAQEWIRSNIALRVTEFTEEQVRNARMVIGTGYAAGQGPRQIGLDLVGRVQSGKRVGGIMGLDGPRAERLHNVTIGMRTPEGVRHLVIKHNDGTLGMRYQVNKATAQRITRAYNAGTEVPAADRLISETQYRNALLQARATTVASTETASAVMGARQEEWIQLAESQGLDEKAIKKTWRHRRGAEKQFRADHLALSGQSVMGLRTPFIMGDGTQMQHAHDPRGGAKQVVGCGCDTEFVLVRGV